MASGMEKMNDEKKGSQKKKKKKEEEKKNPGEKLCIHRYFDLIWLSRDVS